MDAHANNPLNIYLFKKNLFICDIWIILCILGQLWFKNMTSVCDEDSHMEGDSG